MFACGSSFFCYFVCCLFGQNKDEYIKNSKNVVHKLTRFLIFPEILKAVSYRTNRDHAFCMRRFCSTATERSSIIASLIISTHIRCVQPIADLLHQRVYNIHDYLAENSRWKATEFHLPLSDMIQVRSSTMSTRVFVDIMTSHSHCRASRRFSIVTSTPPASLDRRRRHLNPDCRIRSSR